MEICHSQPHLVSPMRLVLYDNLPSPTSPPPIPRRASSLPSRMMMDGKQLVSRASSIRTSMSFRRPSSIGRNRISISAPSDFRQVPSATITEFPERMQDTARHQNRRQFQPLELSIYDTPEHRLPDLPSFEDFQTDNENAPVMKRPEQALSLSSPPISMEFPLSRRSTASFHLPRKPVGSGARRTSSVQMRPSSTVTTVAASPLIPHFAMVPGPNAAGGPALRSASMSGPALGTMSGRGVSSRIAGCDPTTLQDRSILFDPSLDKKHTLSLPPPPLFSDTKISPVAQWLFPTATANNNMTFPSPPSSPFKSHFRSRSRNLSGSTLASGQTYIHTKPHPLSYTQTAKHTPCFSTDSNNTTIELAPVGTAISDNAGPAWEKGLDAGIISKPCVAAVDERVAYHPTIYEGEQMHMAGGFF